MKQIKDFIGKKTAIHCETEEEALQILTLLDKEKYTIHDFNNNIKIKELFKTVKQYENDSFCFGIDGKSVAYCHKSWYEKYNYNIIKASEFLVPELEYGYPIGCLNWAYEVAKEEGKVCHTLYGICELNSLGSLCQIKNNTFYVLDIKEKSLINWCRKIKTPKEELRAGILNTLKITQIEDYVYDNLKNLLEKYKIEKK